MTPSQHPDSLSLLPSAAFGAWIAPLGVLALCLVCPGPKGSFVPLGFAFAAAGLVALYTHLLAASALWVWARLGQDRRRLRSGVLIALPLVTAPLYSLACAVLFVPRWTDAVVFASVGAYLLAVAGGIVVAAISQAAAKNRAQQVAAADQISDS
ncbi:MAG TPA: hypothetical protein VNK04_04860 [Gemmataceae bacterium]|nr:hypothetical protein [Gemmataceae bacterium]